jgi:hypothetical protein
LTELDFQVLAYLILEKKRGEYKKKVLYQQVSFSRDLLPDCDKGIGPSIWPFLFFLFFNK